MFTKKEYRLIVKIGLLNMQYEIYSVEDDSSIANLINITLTKQGYKVLSFSDGESFLKAFKEKKPDLALIDLMLPDISGSEIIKTIRSDVSNDDINIIVISANRMIMDKVGNLDLGADDYIEKPFDLLELISRVNTHLRRRKKSDVLSVGNLSIDTSKRTCTLNDEEVLLTTREFDILTLLVSSAGKTVTREQILKKIWGIDDKNLETRTIDMHIKSLRKKLNDVNQEIIVTVYGVGYKINI